MLLPLFYICNHMNPGRVSLCLFPTGAFAKSYDYIDGTHITNGIFRFEFLYHQAMLGIAQGKYARIEHIVHIGCNCKSHKTRAEFLMPSTHTHTHIHTILCNLFSEMIFVCVPIDVRQQNLN